MALVKIGKAAEMLGVEVQTLRKWEESGELIPDRRSKGGTRYYDVGKLMGLGNEDMPTIGYARVSSHDQKSDLVRQQELLEAFCAAKGWRHEVIADLGSGLNPRQKGLNHLLELILRKRIRRLVLTHKDRLLRFGSELIFALCEIQNIEIVIINKGDPPTFEEELAQDVIEIVTAFSARLYGSRSHKTKRLLNERTDSKNEDGSFKTRDAAIVKKSVSPEDIPDQAVRSLLVSMADLHLQAGKLLAARLEERRSRDVTGT
jgi:predicted site-specific integrase-resolvase